MSKVTYAGSLQWPITAVVELNHEDFDGTTPASVTRLPDGAVITAVSTHVETALSGTVALKFEDGTALATVAIAAGDTAITGFPKRVVAAGEITATPSAALTAGKALVCITYVVPGRTNEVGI